MNIHVVYTVLIGYTFHLDSPNTHALNKVCVHSSHKCILDIICNEKRTWNVKFIVNSSRNRSAYVSECGVSHLAASTVCHVASLSWRTWLDLLRNSVERLKTEHVVKLTWCELVELIGAAAIKKMTDVWLTYDDACTRCSQTSSSSSAQYCMQQCSECREALNVSIGLRSHLSIRFKSYHAQRYLAYSGYKLRNRVALRRVCKCSSYTTQEDVKHWLASRCTIFIYCL